MKEEYQSLIDKRNADLWREMNAHFNITLKKSPESNYITSFHPSDVTILVDHTDINPAPFTHELLHLYIKHKQTMILKDLSESTATDNELLHLLSPPVVNHISNCLEHFKMIPMFLGRGFGIQFFTKDFHQQLMDMPGLEKLTKSYLKNGIHDGRAVKTFITNFFSMKASANKAHNYAPYFSALSKLDEKLYSILDDFWAQWLTFKIGDPPEEYQAMLESFLSAMREWTKGKTLIY